MLIRFIGRDHPRPWNKGLLVGQKKPLQPKHVWSIRVRLEIAHMWRDLAARLVPDISSRADFMHALIYHPTILPAGASLG